LSIITCVRMCIHPLTGMCDAHLRCDEKAVCHTTDQLRAPQTDGYLHQMDRRPTICFPSGLAMKPINYIACTRTRRQLLSLHTPSTLSVREFTAAHFIDFALVMANLIAKPQFRLNQARNFLVCILKIAFN